MKTWIAFLLLSAPALAPAFAKAPAGRQEKLKWNKDHDAALQEAKKAGKYIVVHFSGSD